MLVCSTHSTSPRSFPVKTKKTAPKGPKQVFGGWGQRWGNISQSSEANFTSQQTPKRNNHHQNNCEFFSTLVNDSISTSVLSRMRFSVISHVFLCPFLVFQAMMDPYLSRMLLFSFVFPPPFSSFWVIRCATHYIFVIQPSTWATRQDFMPIINFIPIITRVQPEVEILIVTYIR